MPTRRLGKARRCYSPMSTVAAEAERLAGNPPQATHCDIWLAAGWPPISTVALPITT